jgi:predicted ATPase/DNA-binding CsgD family transcriptional regulator
VYSGLSRSPDAVLPLVGRGAELAALESALVAPGTRLLTLTGPPGVGKTRLALAVAGAVSARFADGVVLVDLSPVRDPDLVLPEVARALGLRDSPGGSLTERLGHVLADRELLLVVDNCEHVLAAGPELAAPLRTCAGLRLLATSRERLNLGGEREVPVPPLALPGLGDLTEPARLAAVPSVALLVARVRDVRPDFAVTAANAAAVAEVCLRLDGLPLALELAAARTKLFGLGELADRLRSRMGILTSNARDAPARHRTLRAALEWSHELLAADERAMFRRLSVFVGAWTLPAADRVCADGDVEVLATVGSLVDKSLVQRSAGTDDVAEFVLLEGLREYAAELLGASDDEEQTRARHAAYYARLAAAGEARIGMPAEAQWWTHTSAAEEANLGLAFAHCLAAGPTEAALRLAAALGWHSYFHGHLGTGRARLGQALDAVGRATVPPPDDALAAALVVAGVLAWTVGDCAEAERLLGRSLAISTASGDLRQTAVASSFLGHLARAIGRLDEARERHELAAALYQRIASTSGYAWTRHDLGLLARRRGDLQAAGGYLREGLTLFRGIDYTWAVGRCAWALAAVQLSRGEVDDAAELLAEALACHEEVGDGRGLALCMEAAAGVAHARGFPDTAARLLGAAEGERGRLAAPLPDEERDAHEEVLGAVGRALGADGADRARRAGRAMGASGAGDLARVAVASRASAPSRPTRPAGPLTVRERQVADLVAAGRTNRQIGRALGIAEKTVEVHVHHLITKLGAQSRTEVAAWVVTGGRELPDDTRG